MIQFLKHNGSRIITLLDQGLVSGINFLISILLANHLGLEEYGIYVLIWTVIIFISSIHQACIIMPMYTLFSKQKDGKQYLASLSAVHLIFSIATLGIIGLMTFILLSMFPEWNRPFLNLLLPITAVLFISYDFLRRLFFLNKTEKIALLTDCMIYGAQPFLLLYLSINNWLSISNYLIGLNCLFIVVSLLIIVNDYTFGVSLKGITKTVSDHWHFSVYLIGTSILQWFSGNAFLLMAASLLGSAAIGAIRMAQNLVGILHILFLAMENSIPARAAEIMHQNGKESMFQYMYSTAKRGAIPTITMLTLIIVFRQVLVSSLYGSEFLDYHNFIVAFALLYVLVFIGTILRFTIRTIERNKIIFISCVVSAIFSALAANPFIQYWGLSGVLVGLFITQLLTIGIFIISLKTELKWLFK